MIAPHSQTDYCAFPGVQAERAKAAAQPYVDGAQEVAADTAAAAKGTGEVRGFLLIWLVAPGELVLAPNGTCEARPVSCCALWVSCGAGVDASAALSTGI